MSWNNVRSVQSVAASAAALRAGVAVAALAMAGTAGAQERTTPEPAWEGFRVCNRSMHDNVEVAKALNTSEKTADGRAILVSEGWWKLKRGECMVLWRGPLKYRYYLVYAQAGKNEWAGEHWVCVSREPFTIRQPLCGPDYYRRKFQEVDTGDEQQRFTYNLND